MTPNVVAIDRGKLGWEITLAYPGAYTDGSSRVEQHTIAYADASDPDTVLQLLTQRVGADVSPAVGKPVAAPGSKAAALVVVQQQYAEWQMATRIRDEAVVRGETQAVQNALTTFTTTQWGQLKTALLAWIAAT